MWPTGIRPSSSRTAQALWKMGGWQYNPFLLWLVISASRMHPYQSFVHRLKNCSTPSTFLLQAWKSNPFRDQHSSALFPRPRSLLLHPGQGDCFFCIIAWCTYYKMGRYEVEARVNIMMCASSKMYFSLMLVKDDDFIPYILAIFKVGKNIII